MPAKATMRLTTMRLRIAISGFFCLFAQVTKSFKLLMAIQCKTLAPRSQTSAVGKVDASRHLRIVGGLAGLHQYKRHDGYFGAPRLSWIAGGKTAQGLACDRGDDACIGDYKIEMVVVPVSARDERQRGQMLRSTVVPSRLKRCCAGFADIWSQAISPVSGIKAVSLP